MSACKMLSERYKKYMSNYNNPDKITQMRKGGINVVKRIPLIINSNKHNKKYIQTKQSLRTHVKLIRSEVPRFNQTLYVSKNCCTIRTEVAPKAMASLSRLMPMDKFGKLCGLQFPLTVKSAWLLLRKWEVCTLTP